MGHNHFHQHEHNLKHCDICDVVYCTICGREWRGQSYYVPYYPNWYPTWIISNTGAISTPGGSYQITVGDHTHGEG